EPTIVTGVEYLTAETVRRGNVAAASWMTSPGRADASAEVKLDESATGMVAAPAGTGPTASAQTAAAIATARRIVTARRSRGRGRRRARERPRAGRRTAAPSPRRAAPRGRR